MENNDDKPLPRSTFSGSRAPINFSVVDDDQFEEGITRRVRGFNPMQSPTIHDFVLPSSSTSSSLGSSIATTLLKRTSHALSTETIGWILEEAPVLPSGHPLERTAVFCPHSSAQSIASRVSATLKSRSIQAEYRGAEAECLTRENVLFSVFLYRGKREFDHGIICEVLRRCGESFQYWEDSAAILDAAKNKTQAEPRKKKARSIAVVDDDSDPDVSSESLQFLRNMFDAGVDSQLLGLQILASMTDSSKMGLKTATATSRVLMEPGNEIAGIVLNLIHEPSLKLQGMIVLSNIASVADLPLPILKQFLIAQLQSADSQVAYLASKCLKPKNVDADFADAIYKAKQLGGEQHDGLYKQAVALLESNGGF